jgi:hypothetical protein
MMLTTGGASPPGGYPGAGEPLSQPAGASQSNSEAIEREPCMDRKAELKRAYKENPPLAGVYRILNRANGKIYVGKGLNVQGILNSQEAQLKFGSHRVAALQQDWNQYGSEQFVFEVLDYLHPAEGCSSNRREDLEELESLWLDNLQPYGSRGYNTARKKIGE